MSLAVSDWIVFFIVILATIAVVAVAHILPKYASHGSVFRHLLVGRALTLPMFVVTTISTLFGSFFGVTQFAYERGVYNLLTQGIFWYTAYIVAAVVIVPKIRRSKVPQTLPDLLRESYGPVSEKIGALFNFIDIVPITFAMGLGTCVKAITGLSHTVGMCAALGFVILYSAFGRFRAVVFSDFLQCVIMYAGAFLVVAFSLKNYGFEALVTNLPESHWQLFPEDISLTFMWGFFALAALTDPSFYHRCFAAKSTATAQKGIIVSTIFWFIFDIFTTLGGMYARVAMPNADPQDAYLNYALHILPSPLGGMLLAGILATVLSAIDTYLFIGSTTLFKNLLPMKQRNFPGLKYLGMVIIGGLAAFLANFFDGSIYDIWKTLGSLSSACLLAPLIVGLFSERKIADHGFAFACILGIVCLTTWKYLPREGILADIDEFYLGLFGSMFGIALAHFREIKPGALSEIFSQRKSPRTEVFDKPGLI